MRFTYDWTQVEWNEAVTLATEPNRRRGGGVSGIVYALVGIPLLGAVVLNGVRAVHASQRLTLAGTAVPLLLLLLFACTTVALLISHWGRRWRLAVQSPMPGGEWEAVLQESGWSFQKKADTVPAENAKVHDVAARLQADDLTVTESSPAVTLQPWTELTGSRAGERVMVLLHRNGFHAMPIRCVTPDQASHIHRMVIRKLRPAPASRQSTHAS